MKHCPSSAALAISCLALPLLSGCATTRYVQTYCLTPQQLQKLKDAEPPKVGNKLTGQAQEDEAIVAGSAIELRQYDGDLLNVLGGCVEPGK